MTLLTISLYILGGLAIWGAMSMVVAQHPMRCAVSLLFVMIVLACIYALLSAPFMAVLQLIIYAGAIMTLIIFIVTLVDVKGDDLKQIFSQIKWLAVPTIFALFYLGAMFLAARLEADGKVLSDFGSVKLVSRELLSRYLFHFEVASLVLLVGIIGISTLRGKKEQQQ